MIDRSPSPTEGHERRTHWGNSQTVPPTPNASRPRPITPCSERIDPRVGIGNSADTGPRLRRV